jgi:hypothetical protein
LACEDIEILVSIYHLGVESGKGNVRSRLRRADREYSFEERKGNQAASRQQKKSTGFIESGGFFGLKVFEEERDIFLSC